jgi:hypothetical protein
VNNIAKTAHNAQDTQGKKIEVRLLQSKAVDIEFDNFHQNDIFKCMSWVYRSFFSGDDLDILKEEFKTYLMAQCLPLNSITFCDLHIYSLLVFHRTDRKRSCTFARFFEAFAHVLSRQ